MADKTINGSCLCGNVRYQYKGEPLAFQYCHCSRCRKFTSSAHAANIIIKPDQFEWLSGEDQVGRYELPDAKHFATGFCKTCGSSTPWINKSGRALIIPAGTLDDDPGTRPVQNIFFGSRAPWYVDASELMKWYELPENKYYISPH